MANLQYKSYTKQECGGLSGLGVHGYDYQVSPTWDWSDIADSGSRDYTVKFGNSVNRGVSIQWVEITLRTSWNLTKDKNNRITVKGTTLVRRITLSGGAGANERWRLQIRTEAGNAIGGLFEYTGLANGTWENWGSQDYSFVIEPGATSNRSAVRVASWSVRDAVESDCNEFVDKGLAGFQLRNVLPWIYDDPVINKVSCASDNGGAKFTWDVNYGATLPASGNNTVKVEVSLYDDFKTVVWSGTSSNTSITAGEGTLASNTKYYVRYTATNRAGKTAVATCEFITLCRNNLSNPVSVRYDREMIDLSVLYGGRIYKPSTKIYYRKCGASNWTEWPVPAETTNCLDSAKILLTGLDSSTCYEMQARTTTTAGTYTGNTLRFTTADADRVSGVITSATPWVDDDFETHAEVCFRVTGNCTPITAHLEYRIKNGYSDEWQPTPDKVYPNEENEDCVILDELIPNQTVYEVRVHAVCGESESDGTPGEFTTPLLPKPTNYNCENYQYMVDMICQSFEAVKSGMKTIYANEDAKELCDPYSDNPTFASMWSRVQRFLHGAICVMCDMTDVEMKSALPGQVYMGEIGWTDMDDEPIESSKYLVESNGIYEAIDEAIHQVWHSHGSVDYLVGTKSDLNGLAGVQNGDTALVADEDYIYEYRSGSWVKKEAAGSDDFTVVHINKASETDLGRVKAGTSWYYFGGEWQHLDADTQDLEQRLDTFEATPFVQRQADADGDILIQTNSENFDYNTLPSGQRVICFVTESPDKPAAGMHHIVYETGPNATIVASEDLVDGATPQRPVDPERVGYVFVRWEDVNYPGVPFNFDQPVYQDYHLVAIWTPVLVVVSYNLNGGTGDTPASVTLNYGDPLPLPDGTGFSREGATFGGWARNGVPVTANDVATGDTVLYAIWVVDQITLTFHPENGQPDIIKKVDYGAGLAEFADPTKENSVFLGWFYADGEPYYHETPMYVDTELYARYAQSTYTVTFEPGGGNDNFTRTVNYEDTVAQPDDPVWKG